jgi:diacylglycerol kinase (ATP)
MIINDKWRSINVAGFGLDTEVLQKYYQMKHFSQKFRYKYAVFFKTLFFKWHKGTIKIDNQPAFDTVTLLLSVGNGQTVGGGINMCPTATIDDGYLDFTYIERFPRWKTIWALRRVLNGKILQLSFVKNTKCKQVDIQLSSPVFQYDGILVEGERTLSVKISDQKINFIG